MNGLSDILLMMYALFISYLVVIIFIDSTRGATMSDSDRAKHNRNKTRPRRWNNLK